MREIRFDLLADPTKFELICLPCSCYQKKDGTIPAPTDGFLSQLAEKVPNLLADIGKQVEKLGNCPSIVSSIPNTGTKFASFPVAPTSLRAENPDDYVYQRLKGEFKPFSLVPGWAIAPRSDMVEFAAIKLAEIIKYYKLTKVAIPFEMFTLDKEDQNDYTRIRNIMQAKLGDEVFVVSRPLESAEGNISSAVSSSVTYEEEE